jgi:predicted ATPase/transcriptional regulator with XRE-family HTH domain
LVAVRGARARQEAAQRVAWRTPVQEWSESLPFSALLRQQRLAAGLTQAALAERAGLSERTVQDLERGIARPRRDTIGRLLNALAPPADVRAQLEAVTATPRRHHRRAHADERQPGTIDTSGRAGSTSVQAERQNTLPIALTSFVGREREIAAVVALLETRRLVTLTGPGGSGKTRVALEAGRRAATAFPDGSVFVSLAVLSEPELVTSTIAAALRIREEKGLPLMRTLQAAIGDRSTLLILDNFEHLLPAAARVFELLAACPHLRVLVTSRELLRLSGEQVYPVPPLALPERSRLPTSGEESMLRAGQSEAVRLFVDRARSARPDFRLDARTAPAVTAICVRVDGLPLAVELAAARIRYLSLGALRDRLDERLSLLTGGSRDAPQRQQTLSNTIGWSYDLLDENEKRLFSRLAVFSGGCTLDAIEAVAIDEAPGATTPDPHTSPISQTWLLDAVGSLVDQSLLLAGCGPAGESRFHMLETIREFGSERMEASGEGERRRWRHADYYLRLAERAQPELIRWEQRRWLDCLETEHGNLRAALAWSLNVAKSAEEQIASRLVLALYRFWQRRNHVDEGREWAERAIRRHGPIRDVTRGRLLNAAGVLARSQADCPSAQRYFEESLSIHRAYEDQRGIANALHNLGNIVHLQGDYVRAKALLDESLAMWPRLGDAWGHGMALAMRGHLARDQGDLLLAIQCYEASHNLARQVGDRWSISGSLGELGMLAREQGDYDRASDFLNQCLKVRAELGDLDGVARSLMHLGHVARLQKNAAQALALCHQSLKQYAEIGHRWGPVVCFEQLAAVAVLIEQPMYSAVLLGAAEAGRETISEPLPMAERAAHDLIAAEARSRLGDTAFAGAKAAGRAMAISQAVNYGLGLSVAT